MITSAPAPRSRSAREPATPPASASSSHRPVLRLVGFGHGAGCHSTRPIDAVTGDDCGRATEGMSGRAVGDSHGGEGVEIHRRAVGLARSVPVPLALEGIGRQGGFGAAIGLVVTAPVDGAAG